MLAYKMFNKDLTCTKGRGKFQYVVGEWMEEPSAYCANCGFHCAENPLDCLTYYPDWDSSRCFLVETGGSIDEDGHDSKISCTRIRLVKEITLRQFVAAAALYMAKHPHMPWNGNVSRTDAKADVNHFAICRGKPGLKAMGKTGDVLAILEENEDGEIAGLRIMEIDGTDYLPDTWYDIDGMEIGGPEDE